MDCERIGERVGEGVGEREGSRFGTTARSYGSRSHSDCSETADGTTGCGARVASPVAAAIDAPCGSRDDCPSETASTVGIASDAYSVRSVRCCCVHWGSHWDSRWDGHWGIPALDRVQRVNVAECHTTDCTSAGWAEWAYFSNPSLPDGVCHDVQWSPTCDVRNGHL